MKRAAIIAVAIIFVGVVAWLIFGPKPQTSTTETNPVAEVDQTQSTQVTVTMKNTAYTPQNIKIKKGTTVRWVNEDDVRHNVVALDDNDQSGLPATNELFGKGGSYSYTFNVVGTYEYKCTPHPFMTGKVEVVE